MNDCIEISTRCRHASPGATAHTMEFLKAHLR